MLLDAGKYYGNTVKELELDHFNLTLTVYRPGETVPKHTHENSYLSLLLAGSYSEEGGKLQHILKAGNSIFRSSVHEHTNTFGKVTGKCFNLEIKSDTSHVLDPWLPKDRSFTLKHPLLELYRLYYLFLQTSSSDTLDLLSFEVISQLTQTQRTEKHGKAVWISQVKELIHDTPEKQHRLEEIAHLVKVHPVYLVRKFKEKTGLRLWEYITRVRLEKSAIRIITGEMNLTQVAYDCGFYDQSHFSRSFKAYFGTSPNQFRKVLRG